MKEAYDHFEEVFATLSAHLESASLKACNCAHACWTGDFKVTTTTFSLSCDISTTYRCQHENLIQQLTSFVVANTQAEAKYTD